MFTVSLPAIWVVTSAAGFRFPGDEYGLWAVGSLPGLWFPVLLGCGDLKVGLWLTLLAGGAVTAGFGAVTDRLRVRWLPWYALWVVAAGVICGLELSSYPSWAKAMSKNGSFQAYALSSLNVGLMLSTLAMIAATAAWRGGGRLIARFRPAGRKSVTPPVP
jgi:hypothetical protein